MTNANANTAANYNTRRTLQILRRLTSLESLGAVLWGVAVTRTREGLWYVGDFPRPVSPLEAAREIDFQIGRKVGEY